MPFNANKYKFNLPKDAPKWALELATQLRGQALELSRSVASDTGSTIIISGTTSTSSSSSGGSSASTSNVKSGLQTVTAATATYVPFPSAFTTTPQVVHCFLHGSDGYSSGFIHLPNLSITTAGFTIPAADIMMSGTISYIAVTN